MNRLFRPSVVTLAVLVATLGVATRAQAPAAKPDFNGTWNINLAQSTFSPAPQPASQT